MRFLADMGISPRSVAFLNSLGHDAVHLHDEGLDRLSDANILAKARNEDRIVITHDLDFGDLMAAGGARLPSIIILRLRNMSADQVNRYLEVVISSCQRQLDTGAIVSVTERHIRVRVAHWLMAFA